jgi:hypothetical protein
MRYPTSQTSVKPGTPLGVFADLEEADNYAGACTQELQEKVGYGAFFCKVELSTFYG